VFFVPMLLFAGQCFGQLHIGDGTTWVSTPATVVVLDDLEMQYDASQCWKLNSIGAENNIPDDSTLRFTCFDAELNGLPEDSWGLGESMTAGADW
jgi:hypothetical protein